MFGAGFFKEGIGGLHAGAGGPDVVKEDIGEVGVDCGGGVKDVG